MTKTIKLATAVLAALALASACGGSATTPTVQPRPSGVNETGSVTSAYVLEYGGSDAVYDRIAGTLDCSALQTEFDNAAADNATAEPGTARFDWSHGYMVAADDQMRAIGCYN